MDEKREKEIIRKVLSGKPQPFEELVRAYQRQIFSLMVRSVKERETAADLAQDVFIKAYSKLESFDLKKRFFPWLYTIALNVLRDHGRTRGRDVHVFMEDPEVATPTQAVTESSSTAERHVDSQTVYGFIEAMAPNYREALILRYKYEFSMQEIAEALHISVSGAKMRVKRGMEIVRNQFREVGNGSS